MTQSLTLDYARYASAFNEIAGKMLPSPEIPISGLSLKISIGLSLQAIELAGKSLLLRAGLTQEQVQSRYRNHDLLKILRDAQRNFRDGGDELSLAASSFLDRFVVIDGVTTGVPIERYLEEHFSNGERAKVRNYFYPDSLDFIGPNVPQGVHSIASDLVSLATNLASTALDCDSTPQSPKHVKGQRRE